MTTTRADRRGQPLAALALILAVWIATRVILWEPLSLAPMVRILGSVPAGVPSLPVPAPFVGDVSPSPQLSPAIASFVLSPRPEMRVVPAARPATPPPPPEQVSLRDGRADLAAGHALLWLAAVSEMRSPITAAPSAATPPVSPPKRWSADGWLFLRPGGAVLTSSGSMAPAYGASQVGAVLRYRLAPGSRFRPEAFARVAAALVRSGERELALGLSARAIPEVPMRLAAELRATQTPSGMHLRPAAFVVSEAPPVTLPARFRLETYAAAGYVAGADATGFVDGQARLTRRLVERGRVRLDVGAGAWGGAQRGAARLDVGPSAALSFAAGQAQARVAADWRFRIAGNAAPGSGPALTISAGF